MATNSKTSQTSESALSAEEVQKLKEQVKLLQQENQTLKTGRPQVQSDDKTLFSDLPKDNRAIAVLYRPGFRNHRNFLALPYLQGKRPDGKPDFGLQALQPKDINWVPTEVWKKVCDYESNRPLIQELVKKQVGDNQVLTIYVPTELKDLSEAVTTKHFLDPIAQILIDHSSNLNWLDLSLTQETRKNLQEAIKTRKQTILQQQGEKRGLSLGGYSAI